MAVKVGLMSNGDSALGGGQLLPIGALAELTGKRPSSIRYYEQIGLLPQPVRIAGRRMYDPATVRTLAMIETGQRAGLALDEIKALLSASPEDRAAIERLRELADRKLPEIVALIQRSELVRDWLECAARCECPDLDECPLFDEPSPLPRPPAARLPPPPQPRPGRAARDAGHESGLGFLNGVADGGSPRCDGTGGGARRPAMKRT